MNALLDNAICFYVREDFVGKAFQLHFIASDTPEYYSEGIGRQGMNANQNQQKMEREYDFYEY